MIYEIFLYARNKVLGIISRDKRMDNVIEKHYFPAQIGHEVRRHLLHFGW